MAGVACRIAGVASAYNVLVDTAPTRTRIKPGAFAASLADPAQRRRLRLLYQHDPSQPLGRVTRAEERPDGLHFAAEIADTALGRDVAALVKSGTLREVSIGFDSEEHEWVEHRAPQHERVRDVTRPKLWEISFVTCSANPEARIVEAHRRDAADPLDAALAAEELRLREVELSLAEDQHLDALAAHVDGIARDLGLAPTVPRPPEPGSVLGVALAVRAREERGEALAGMIDAPLDEGQSHRRGPR